MDRINGHMKEVNGSTSDEKWYLLFSQHKDLKI